MQNDSGAIVIGWLAKLVVVLGILGVVFFELLAITTAHLGVQDQAYSASQAAASTWLATQDVNKSYAAAVQTVSGDENLSIDIKKFSIDPDGTVHLTLDRVATTMVMQHIPPLDKYRVITYSASARARVGQ